MNKTPYQIAWEKYTASSDYERAEKTLNNNKVVKPYSTNILRRAFDAGWNSSVKKIN